MPDNKLEKLRGGVLGTMGAIATTASEVARGAYDGVEGTVDAIATTTVGAARGARDLATQTAAEVREALPSLEDILAQAVRLPGAQVDRATFLSDTLLRSFPDATVREAIELTPAQAGIPTKTLRHFAGKAMGKEARRTTVVSMAVGLPGGMAAAATIPADLVQLYGHLLRAIQMLTYLYGWRDTCAVTGDAMDSTTRRALLLFLGVMAGNEQAQAVLRRLAPLRSSGTVREAIDASDAIDDIAQVLEARMAHRTTGAVVGKSIPLAGAVISAALSHGGFSDMWKLLRDQLEQVGT